MKLKRTIVSIVSLIVVGVVVGLIYYASVTKVTRPAEGTTNTVNEQGQAEPVAKTPDFVSLSGAFEGVDATHTGGGSVVTTNVDGKIQLKFLDDFTVSDGPDLYVYLSPNGPSDALGDFHSVGVLKAKAGTQTYDLPNNYQDYKTVVIWCKQFDTPFAKAQLFQES